MKVIRYHFKIILFCVLFAFLEIALLVKPQVGIRESFFANKEIYSNIVDLKTELPIIFLFSQKQFVDPGRIHIIINDMSVITNEPLNDSQINLIEQSKACELFAFPNKEKPSISQITIKENYVVFDENTAIKRHGIIYLRDESSCSLNFSVIEELDDNWYYFKYEP